MRGLWAIPIMAVSLFAANTATYEQALQLYNKTEYKGAVAMLKSLPQNAATLELLGRSYLMEAEFRKASDVLEKAAAQDPDNSMIWTWLGRAYGRRAETSFALSAMGLANKARESFERAVQLDPKNLEAVNDLFMYYVEAPGMVGGGHDKARNLLPLIGKMDPAEAEFAHAQLAERAKEQRSAEGHLREAIQLAPREVGRFLDLALYLARHGRFEESESVFLQAEKVDPATPRLLFARAEALINAHRDLAKARALLQKYLSAPNLTPNDPPRSEALKLLRKAQGS
ncbi:MAG TPA: tetratricopeptide repeat protein [Bryobacteraceae bacterium]|nr:tetratricopeptide repeat protein [Bryobacteraceae bacterium]